MKAGAIHSLLIHHRETSSLKNIKLYHITTRYNLQVNLMLAPEYGFCAVFFFIFNLFILCVCVCVCVLVSTLQRFSLKSILCNEIHYYFQVMQVSVFSHVPSAI